MSELVPGHVGFASSSSYNNIYVMAIAIDRVKYAVELVTVDMSLAIL